MTPPRDDSAPARTREGGRRWEPPLDPTSWSGALMVMGGLAAAVLVVQIIDAANNYSLNRFALHPRHVDGLWGIGTQPFLHDSYGHMLSDTVPLILIGWVLMLSGLRIWTIVSAIVLVGGGLLTWLAGPGTVPLGSGGLVFGWLGYLLARAYFSRKIKWILVAVLVLFFFGALLASLLPSYSTHSAWQPHLYGFAAGVLAGAVLHPRPKQRRPRAARGPAVS